MKRNSESPEISRLLVIVATVVVIATLYFARLVFIPLALAIFFSLVLAPLVGFLERLKVPRVLAILLVVGSLASIMGMLAWQASQQLVDLSNQVPAYKKTLQDKIHSVKGIRSQSLNKASDTVKELEQEITAGASGQSSESASKKKTPPQGTSPARPLAVEIVPPPNPLESIENLLGPLATGGMVMVFTIFMLVGREDLRNRLIRLAGRGRLNAMTQAMDEGTQRINRYLLLQLLVNIVYGLVIGIALHFIGIPNAALWGGSAAILRFLPYVGAPMAALPPVILALGAFPGWHHALATAGLFFALELIVANLIEPFLYGAHIGLAPLAILVAAVFWTLIWGFPGLVLSTPLTVCLVVLGRYIPSLSFFNVLLGGEQVLPPHAQYYQRLLASDSYEARQVLEQCLKEKPLEELYSAVIIPALSLAEHDRHHNALGEDKEAFIYQSAREMVEEFGCAPVGDKGTGETEISATPPASGKTGNGSIEVVCVPARDDADDVVAMMLSQLLEHHGHRAQSLPIGTTEEMLAQVAELQPHVVCISALPPFAVNHARALYLKLRNQFPDLYVVICLWHFEGDGEKVAHRLKLKKDHGFFTTLPQVLQHIAFRAEKIALAADQPR